MKISYKYILLPVLWLAFFQMSLYGQSEKYDLLAEKINAGLDTSLTETKQYIDLYREWSLRDNNVKEQAQSWIFEGDFLYYSSDIIPSTNAYLKAAELAESRPNLDSITTYGYIYAAYNYNSLNLFDKSIEVLHKGLPYAKVLADSSYLADYYSILGSDYFHMGDLGTSVSYFDSCLMVETRLQDTLGMLKAVNNIGKINLRNGQTAKAIKYYEDALNLGNSVQVSQTLKSIILTNLGHAYLQNNDYDLAKMQYDQSLALNEESKDTFQLINDLMLLSDVSKAKKSFKNGKEYIESAISLISDKTPPVTVANLYNRLGTFLLELKEISAAKEYFTKALELSKPRSILLKQKVALKNLIDIANIEGQYKKASELGDELNDIQEQIIELENAKAIEETNARYKYEEQMKAIQSLENKDMVNSLKIKSLNMKLLWSLLVLALALIGGFFLTRTLVKRYQSKLKQKEEKIKQQQLEIDNIQSIVSKQLQDKTQSQNQLLSKEEVNAQLKTPLTDREYEILVETYNGLSNKEIGDKLFLSVNTIKFHLKKVYNKLEVSNRIQALKVITR